MKLAHESAYIRPKSYKSLKNAPKICPFIASCWSLREENRPWSETGFPLGNLPVRALDSRAQGITTPLACQRWGSSPPSPNLVLTRPYSYPIERATERLRVLRRRTRLSLTVSRLPTLDCHLTPKGTKLALGKRRIGWIPSHPPQNKPPPRLNKTAELRKKQVGSSPEGKSGPTTPGKPPSPRIPQSQTRF